MKLEELAKSLELSVYLLKPEATGKMIEESCRNALKHNLYGVNVNLNSLTTAYRILKDSDVKIVGAVGYPLGANGIESKTFETKYAISAGADEIEVVMDVGALKSQNYDFVSKELLEVVRNANSPVSVIIEVPSLNDEEIETACNLALESGASFVKSSAGMGRQVTIYDVKKMRKAVGNRCGVKGAGQIRDLATHLKILKAGADRNVTSSAVQIIEEYLKEK